MAAEGLTGIDGSVEIDGALIGVLDTWTLDLNMPVVKTGGFGTKWQKNKPGVADGTGNAKGKWARDDASGQGAVEQAFKLQTKVVLTLSVTTESGESYVCPAYITKITAAGNWEGTADFSFDFALDGEPTTYPTHA